MTCILLILGLLSDPSILFVGNSYTFFNGGIWSHVKQIYDSVEADTLRVGNQTIGGASFQNHWNNPVLREELISGEWEMAMFQEQSCMPVINPSQTYLYGDSLAWLASTSFVEPVFFMTWARKNDPLMLEGLDLGYSRMGFEHGSRVAPCGIAFGMIRLQHPEIDPYASDGAHPSVYGTYLAACVMVITVFDTDISAMTVWQPSEISPADGQLLRSMAVSACSTYHQPAASAPR